MKPYGPCDKCGSYDFHLVPVSNQVASVICWKCKDAKGEKPWDFDFYNSLTTKTLQLETIR